MTTAISPTTAPDVATAAGSAAPATPTSAPRPLPEHFYLELCGIRWETYEALVDDVGEQHIGITYDDGRMVLMPPRPVHDVRKTMIARMIEMTSFVMNVPIASYGSTTWRRRDVNKGLEADECYYVQNEPFARGRIEFDLTRDPAPDLAVEVENTHHPLDRPSIYAALGVNEIWQHDGTRLQFLAREADGAGYRSIPVSQAFPFLTPDVIERHLAMVRTAGEYETIRAFSAWLASLPRTPNSSPD